MKCLVIHLQCWPLVPDLHIFYHCHYQNQSSKTSPTNYCPCCFLTNASELCFSSTKSVRCLACLGFLYSVANTLNLVSIHQSLSCNHFKNCILKNHLLESIGYSLGFTIVIPSKFDVPELFFSCKALSCSSVPQAPQVQRIH